MCVSVMIIIKEVETMNLRGSKGDIEGVEGGAEEGCKWSIHVWNPQKIKFNK